MNNDDLLNIAKIQAILFVVGDEGIKVNDLLKIINKSKKTLSEYLLSIDDMLKGMHHGLELYLNNGTIKFITKKNLYEVLVNLIQSDRKTKLSHQALEVLAIIAYNSNNDVTKSEISNIRGVNSDHLVNSLLLKELIEYKGRLEDRPGRPFILKVTNKFFDKFNIEGFSDLPELPKVENANTTDHNVFEIKDQLGNMQKEKSVLSEEVLVDTDKSDEAGDPLEEELKHIEEVNQKLNEQENVSVADDDESWN